MKRRPRRLPRVHRPLLERLEDRLAPAGVVNGDFSISNPADAGFGWSVTGSASVVNNQGVLAENAAVNTEFSQAITIPAGTTLLRFTLVQTGFLANNVNNPPDAFEAALLDGSSNSLLSPVTGLPGTDAFLNIQQTGEVFFSPETTVPGVTTSGSSASLTFPLVVTVNLSGVAAGTASTLFFDLIGFSPSTSSVVIDDVQMFQGGQPPLLTLQLADASDSGLKGDGVTNLNPVTLVGTTDPGQQVLLDLDGDGFDDGTATADASGRFTFSPTLLEGDNPVRVQASSDFGTTTTSLTLTLDTLGPSGSLVSPPSGTRVNADPGFVEVQWGSTGAAVDPTTFGTGDITIPGVDIDRITDLGGNRIRYIYNDDGDTLGPGPVSVSLVAGQVADVAGNTNAALAQSFTINAAPVAGNDNAAANQGTPAVISVLGNDSDSDGTLDVATVTVVTAPSSGTAVANANGTITYTPGAALGNVTFTYTVKDNDGLASNVATVTVIVNAPPVAVNDNTSTRSDTAVNVAVLGNDSDADGTLDATTVTVVTTPASGTAVANADGTITYTPGAALGNVTFTYTVKDNSGAVSNVATVTVFVNAPPVAVNDAVAATQGTPAVITVLSNDSDADGTLDASTVTVVGTPSSGTAVANANGTITYTPGATLGDVTFTYTVKDNKGAVSNAATVKVTVTANPSNTPPVVTLNDSSLVYTENDAPRAVDAGLLVTDADTPSLVGATVKITGNYASNQDRLAFTNQGGISGTFDAGTGTLTLTGTASVAAYQAALRSVTYVNTSENPSAALRTVTVTVNDGAALNNTGSGLRNIEVHPVNDAPVITAPAAAQVFRNGSVTLSGAKLISVADVDAAGLAEKVTLKVTRGVLSLGTTAGLTFDSGFGNNTGEIHMTGTLAALDAALAALRFTPPRGTAGPGTLQVSVDDQGHSGGAAQTATRTVQLSVVARPPILLPRPPYVTSRTRVLDVTVANGLLAGASSPDHAPLVLRLVGAAPVGLTLRPNGSFRFVPQPGSPSVVTFRVRAFDGLLFSNTVTVRIVIVGPGRGRGF